MVDFFVRTLIHFVSAFWISYGVAYSVSFLWFRSVRKWQLPLATSLSRVRSHPHSCEGSRPTHQPFHKDFQKVTTITCNPGSADSRETKIMVTFYSWLTLVYPNESMTFLESHRTPIRALGGSSSSPVSLSSYQEGSAWNFKRWCACIN
jgi:hypothetical protein